MRLALLAAPLERQSALLLVHFVMLFEKLLQQHLRRKRGSTGAPRLSATSKRLLEPPALGGPRYHD